MNSAALLFLLCATVAPLAPDAAEQAALDRISPADLRGNLSFLASDALEGRDTPSRGLDIAGEFIASQFRRAGLEPVTANNYFQTADYVQITADPSGFDLTLDNGNSTIHINKDIQIQTFSAVDVEAASLVKIENGTVPILTGKVALLELPDMRAAGAHDKYAQYRERLHSTQKANPAAILLLSPGNGPRPPGTRLVEASTAKLPTPPTVILRNSNAVQFLKDNSPAALKVTIHAKAPVQKPVQLRNVAGLLRGSDPDLRDTYVLVTAHYDHIGMRDAGEGDRIYNGANDDGSGTVSAIEIANALAQMPTHPRRSILFMTFFGEEKGLYGSRYYALHPLFPLKQTIAQINLEQLGRTDDTDGPQVASATFTGFDFSDLPAIFEAAGRQTGIRVYKNEKSSDDFFARSDNQSLADAGVPAHTLAVAFEFPDYHHVGDEWQKIDYGNMAKVDRMVALGVLTLANSPEVPHWNTSNPKTEPYRKAASAR
ncbi:MAG: M28 family peptidase [Acidobacteriota bacterium]|nr:M28 family peptidase [Acidobacteriota bacterium]